MNLTPPRSREEALPEAGVFGRDDFLRAKFYSDVVARYVIGEHHAKLVAFAREKRMPFMSFADTLEAMARYLHAGGPIEKLLKSADKPESQLHAEFKFTEIVREAMKKHGTGHASLPFICEGLHQLFPAATREQCESAIKAGITSQGFNATTVIETMFVLVPA